MTNRSVKWIAAAMAATLLPARGSHAGDLPPADAVVDVDHVGASAFFISATTDPSIGLVGADHENPTIRLELEKRYEFDNAEPGSHPFTLIAGSLLDNPSEDALVLTQDFAEGSLEDDPGVLFVDASGSIFFTVTMTFIEEMHGNVLRSPGYRCNIHTPSMRGDIVFAGPTAESIAGALLDTEPPPDHADLNDDGVLDAADMIKSTRLFIQP